MEENRYLENLDQSTNSLDNNNYMSPTYTARSDIDYLTHSNDNKSQMHNNINKLDPDNDQLPYGNHKNGSIINDSSDDFRNDSNNNFNRATSYDDQINDRTKLGINNNDEEYYKMYDGTENRHYEEEFDNEYGSESVPSKQMMHKQMSILDDDAQHQDYIINGEHKSQDEEYLKKQESIMEDDLELTHLEEAQNLKNQQQQQFQETEQDKELDRFDIEMKPKKSVSICEEEFVHEKPRGAAGAIREKRTPKQRWFWAYNRIVHQAQVSKLIYYLISKLRNFYFVFNQFPNTDFKSFRLD